MLCFMRLVVMASIRGTIYDMKVTIIIPTKNDRGYLHHAIDSIKKQTHQDFQILIGKGGTVGENINKCIPYIQGDVVLKIDDDDILPCNAFQFALDGIKDYDFIHGNALRFTSHKSYTIAKPNITQPSLNQLLYHNVIHGGTCYYRKEVFSKWDESLTTGEEYDFNLRLLSENKTIGHVDDILYFYRLHEKQKSIGNKEISYQDARQKIINEIKERYGKCSDYNEILLRRETDKKTVGFISRQFD